MVYSAVEIVVNRKDKLEDRCLSAADKANAAQVFGYEKNVKDQAAGAAK